MGNPVYYAGTPSRFVVDMWQAMKGGHVGPDGHSNNAEYARTAEGLRHLFEDMLARAILAEGIARDWDAAIERAITDLDID